MKKPLSMFLALNVIFTMLPVWGMAEKAHTSIDPRAGIVEFAPLEETEKTVAVGASIKGLKLPRISDGDSADGDYCGQRRYRSIKLWTNLLKGRDVKPRV